MSEPKLFGLAGTSSGGGPMAREPRTVSRGPLAAQTQNPIIKPSIADEGISSARWRNLGILTMRR